jgi:hypothetical protein
MAWLAWCDPRGDVGVPGVDELGEYDRGGGVAEGSELLDHLFEVASVADCDREFVAVVAGEVYTGQNMSGREQTFS